MRRPYLNQFAAALGTSFTSRNRRILGSSSSTRRRAVSGLAQGHGPRLIPSMHRAPNGSALFQSNQISSFSVVGDPLGTTKGKSGGGGSCWVATFATFGGVASEGSAHHSADASREDTYIHQNQVVTASYGSCSTPITSKDPTVSSVGPYLTVDSCKQSSGTQTSCTTSSSGGMTCSGTDRYVSLFKPAPSVHGDVKGHRRERRR